MATQILYFAKVLEKAEYVEEFLNGSLYMNRLSYFKRRESNENKGRIDWYEGASIWYQKESTKIIIDNVEVDSGDLSGPVSFQPSGLDNMNILCFYAAKIDDQVLYDSIVDMKRSIEITNDCLDLGEYTVVIRDGKEFLRRIKSSVQSSGYGMMAKLVEYYDEDSFSGKFENLESIFMKRRVFVGQSEYRVAIDTLKEGGDAVRVEIGGIRDIARSYYSKDVNSKIDMLERQ